MKYSVWWLLKDAVSSISSNTLHAMPQLIWQFSVNNAAATDAANFQTLWNENQLMSLFYSYIAGSLHVSGPQAHLQESSYSCSHNHWFSICTALVACSVCCIDNIQSTRTERHRYWTNGCVNSCTNSPEDGPVGPKHVEIQQYTNKIVTSVGFHSICWKDARYKKLKIFQTLLRCKFRKAEPAKQMIWQPLPCPGIKRAQCMYLPALIIMLVGS